LYENGTLIENNSGGLSGPNGIELNGWINGAEMSDCDFTDVFVFDTVLSTTDRNFIENSTKNYYVPISMPSITVSPTVTTTYTVTGTNTTGCSATASFTVTVNPVTSNTTTLTATNFYTWPVNGVTYNASGTYTSVINCATEILVLTIITGNGVTNVIPSQCGVTLDAYGSIVYANYVANAERYRFRVTHTGTNQVIVKDYVLRNLFLSSLSFYKYDQDYSIEVAVRRNNIWEAYGTACTVRTPIALTQVTANQCGSTLSNKNQLVYADIVPRANGYRFKVKNMTTLSVQLIDKTNRVFPFSDVTDYSPGTVYQIEVAVLNTDNNYLPYGSICAITTPTLTREQIKATEFLVTAYPNPFNDNFKLDVKSSSADVVQIRVYDMLGKMIETKEVSSSEMDTIEIGSNYPSGVYNVIVSQNDQLQTVRMIKR
jgi:hypothetical protein